MIFKNNDIHIKRDTQVLSMCGFDIDQRNVANAAVNFKATGVSDVIFLLLD